jgi:hypothetical protein
VRAAFVRTRRLPFVGLLGVLTIGAQATAGRHPATGSSQTVADDLLVVGGDVKDGYQVVFALAELDPAFTSNDIIVADTVDGRPLVDDQGPLRIVATSSPSRNR